MKKVHITLVGGQPVPAYIGIKDDGQAQTIVLVCSEQSQEEANRICAQFPKRKVVIELCSPVNLSEIEGLARKLKEKYEDCELTVNLTSGTKLWSLSFFHILGTCQHVRFIYVDQTNVITDIRTKETRMGEIETLTRFELYGTPLTSYVPLEEYTEEDIRVMKEIEKIRKVNIHDFNELTINCQKDDLEVNEPIKATQKGSTLQYSYEGKWARLTLRNYYTGKAVTKEIQSEHIFDILFNSGWFELKTAVELRRNPRVKNLWLNCEFTDSDGNPKNEIDIIANLWNRLLFVECKTMIRDTTDIDKFRSALRNFSGTSSTGIFVTNDRPNTKTEKNYQHAVEKCKDNGILTFNFTLSHDNSLKYPSIRDIIDQQLSTQNKR